MLDRIFSGTTFTSLEKAIDATKLRDEVINQNIANNDTPDYKRRYVEFEQYMLAAMTEDEDSGFSLKRTRRGHFDIAKTTDLASVQPVVMQDESTTLRMDGNNVDIEHEMNELNKNQVHYNTLVEQLNSEIRRLRTAMSRG
jgi:flagellar basal-body rod protein FlgB